MTVTWSMARQSRPPSGLAGAGLSRGPDNEAQPADESARELTLALASEFFPMAWQVAHVLHALRGIKIIQTSLQLPRSGLAELLLALNG